MDPTIDHRLEAIKLAVDSMYYEKDGVVGSYGYAHKDMREIFRRADRIIAYATGAEEADTKGLINKLRDALCVKD